MKIGVYGPANLPTSFVVYLARVTAELESRGLQFQRFGDAAHPPAACNLIWDVRSGGGNPPPESLLQAGLPPLVVTIHGFAPMSLSGREYYRTWRERLAALGYARKQRARWAAAKSAISGVVAVSKFTRAECATHAGLADDLITVCLHGVDASQFVDAGAAGLRERAVLLHVSNNEPRKNVDRIVAAFAQVRRRRPGAQLWLKLPSDAQAAYELIPGVRCIVGHLPTAELAALYARATAFVFPSLYEGFGMPILEAMASGCPVLTSNVSACPEVAGDAALCVDPRSVSALASAMARLLDEPQLRQRLTADGLVQAARFTWADCAAAHLQAFEAAVATR